MKKRDFIKTGLISLGASTIALTGCNNKENNIKTTQDNDAIIPKQTGTYEFSCPLPFDYKTIDDISALNSKLKKSKVVTLFNSVPLPLVDNFNSFIQVNRNSNPDIKTFNDFGKYVKYAQNNGFQFTYLMNSPKVFSKEDFLSFKDEFLYLIDYLKKIGVKNIKVGNTQVCSLLQEYAPNEFTLSASTCFEYHNISQYRHLFGKYANFNIADMSVDENKNFQLLKSMRKTFPNIKVELMINEACIKGCPARVAHLDGDLDFQFKCSDLIKINGFYNFLLKTNVIYPWTLKYYSAIGINNFKYVHNFFDKGNFDISGLSMYLSYIENETKDIDLRDFFNSIFNNDYIRIYDTRLNIPKNKYILKLSELKNYFPDINYFVKNGHNCTGKCGVDCFYCDECAKKLEKFINS